MGTIAEAAVLLAPGRVEVHETTIPDPADGELLVRNLAAAICGSDVHRIFGEARFFREIGDYDYPCPPGYPGHEGIGEVLESRSPRFVAGQLVLTVPDNTCNRTFATHQIIPARLALPVRADQVPMNALMAQQLGTVLYALNRFWPEQEPGDTAVVVGTGSAGLFFVQMLRRLGFARIIAGDLESERLAVARSLGADETVLAAEGRVADMTMEQTGGHGADLAIDASGTDDGRRAAMESVGPGGRIGCYGLPEGPDLTMPFAGLFRRQATLTCAVGAQQEPGIGSFAKALRMIQDGELGVDGAHITHTFGLEKISRALDLARDRRDGAVKVGITFD